MENAHGSLSINSREELHNVDMRAASKMLSHLVLLLGIAAAHGRISEAIDSTGHIHLDGSVKCADCHTDQHHSQTLSACDNCHQTSGWKTECSDCHSSNDLKSSTFTERS